MREAHPYLLLRCRACRLLLESEERERVHPRRRHLEASEDQDVGLAAVSSGTGAMRWICLSEAAEALENSESKSRAVGDLLWKTLPWDG